MKHLVKKKKNIILGILFIAIIVCTPFLFGEEGCDDGFSEVANSVNENEQNNSVFSKTDLIGAEFISDQKLINESMKYSTRLEYIQKKNITSLNQEYVENRAIDYISKNKGVDFKTEYQRIKTSDTYKDILKIQQEFGENIKKITSNNLSRTMGESVENLLNFADEVTKPFEEMLVKLNLTANEKKYVLGFNNLLRETSLKYAKENLTEQNIQNIKIATLGNNIKSVINDFENKVLLDDFLTNDEKSVILKITTIAYFNTEYIQDGLKNFDTIIKTTMISFEGNDSHRLSWNWRVFWTVVAVVVTVAVGIIIPPAVGAVGIVGAISAGATGVALASAAGVSLAVAVTTSVVSGTTYCAANAYAGNNCEDCNPASFVVSVYNCSQ